MIVGDYRTLELDGFADALSWMRREEWKELPPGRYDISPDAYALIQEYTSKDRAEGRFENHHLFADMQMAIAGREMMYASSSPQVAGEGLGYDEDGDIEFFGPYSPEASAVFMEPGLVCILMPGEYHMPCIAWGERMRMRKLVVKVRISC